MTMLQHIQDGLANPEALFTRARAVQQQHYGNSIVARGLVEITNYCRNDCYYCGLRRSNKAVHRYRLSAQQILDACRHGYELGLHSFVLQGGEDTGLSDDWLCQLLVDIKTACPGCAVTLSLGERNRASYAKLRQAGADRYLLRHETANAAHYNLLHPQNMLLSDRLECLNTLRKLGFAVGAGMMVGSPGQTLEHLAQDLTFLQQFQPQMVGIGPFMHQSDTPFAHEPDGDAQLTLVMVALTRLLLPRALIPATTALATLTPDGRSRAVLAGANVVMPNLSPEEVRADYAIYDNKASTGLESAEALDKLKQWAASIGYRLDLSRGDVATD